jgi:HEAT repeat protein
MTSSRLSGNPLLPGRQTNNLAFNPTYSSAYFLGVIVPASLKRLFNIHPGEERLTFLLFALIFLLGVAFNFVETSVFPLFLSEFDSGTLPYLYIINGVVATLLTAGYMQLGRWLSFAQQLLVNLAFLLLLTFAFWLALTLGGGRPVVFAMPVLFQLVVNLGQLAFWTLASRLLNLRQSKRLLGIIGSGLWVAIVLTGFLIPSIVRAIGTVNLLLVSCAGMIAAWIVMAHVTRRYRGELAAGQSPATGPSGAGSASSTMRSPYVLLMFGLTVTTWLAFFFVDNIFFNRVSAQFPTQVELSAFLGLYLAGLGIFTLFINTFVAGQLISRYGVRAGLLVLPVSLLIVTGIFSLVGTVWGIIPLLFWLATINRVLDLAFQFSIDQSAQTILYQPLPASERTRIQTIDNGIIRMIAIGLAGVLLLVLNQVLAFNVVQLAYVLLQIVILWLIGVFLLARLYPGVLAQALARRRLSGVTLTLNDSLTVHVLKKTLQNPNPGPALYALRLLAENSPETLPSLLPDLLRHLAVEVRLESLRRLEDLKLSEARESVWTAAKNDSDAAVRGAALRVLATLGPDEQAALLPYIDSTNPVERAGAMIGLLRYGHDGTQKAAEKFLARLSNSETVSERLEAVHIIGEWADPAACSHLSRLIHDPDYTVGRAAVAAVGRVGCPALWPEVLACLHSPYLRQAATSVLSAGDESALAAIAGSMTQPGQPWVVTAGYIRACGRIGGKEAFDLLLMRIDDPEDRVRGEVLLALSHSGYRADSHSEQATIRARIAAEVKQAVWLLAGIRDCSAEPRLSYLIRVLRDQYEDTRHRIYLLLSLIYNRGAMLEVDECLRPVAGANWTEARRSYALEMLDVTLSPDLKAMVMPLSEVLTVEARLSRLAPIASPPILSPVGRVKEIVTAGHSTNRWLHLTGVYSAGVIQPTDAKWPAMLADYQTREDPLLREVSAWSLARLSGSPFSSPDESGDKPMLSTIEKVIILKNVSLFAQTPDELLAEIAGLLEEIDMPPGQAIFGKGESGDSLFIVVSGQVRVHDDEHTIDFLGESEVFGEMALLDSEPRMASVTTESDTILLKLDRDSFYDLMDTRSEVARGIIQVLSRRLRNRVIEVQSLKNAD